MKLREHFPITKVIWSNVWMPYSFPGAGLQKYGLCILPDEVPPSLQNYVYRVIPERLATDTRPARPAFVRMQSNLAPMILRGGDSHRDDLRTLIADAEMSRVGMDQILMGDGTHEVLVEAWEAEYTAQGERRHVTGLALQAIRLDVRTMRIRFEHLLREGWDDDKE